MSVEGMGRRRPQQDIEKEILQGQEDFVFEQHQRNAKDLIELARPIAVKWKIMSRNLALLKLNFFQSFVSVRLS